jgi:transposase
MRLSVERLQAELKFERIRNEALNFEIARLKRWRFGSSSESLDSSTQVVLFDAIVADTACEDRAARDEVNPPPAAPAAKRQAVRQALPANLPRIERHHEIEATHCACGQALQRIGEEVSEQLDCVPAQFFVLRHIRGKYACACCQTLQAAPMPPQVIDKGIPAPGMLAQVVVAKHDDHLPLYRQTEIYARSGVHIPRSSMAQWIGICGVRLTPLADALKDFILGHDVIHADETPVKLLAPGKGKTAKAYVWVYRTTNFVAQRAVYYDFSAGRGGENARRVLQGFAGTLVSDDFSGYHALQIQGVTAALCMAHARRKLFEAHQFNGSPIAARAVALVAKLYEVERQARELQPEARRLLRQQHAKPVAEELHAWLSGQRPQLAKADVTARAIDYALSNWRGLTRYLDDGQVPIGRVEMWRGGRRSGLSVAAPFVWRCPSNLAVAPFPHPPRRTGRADLPHPALFRRIKPSRSSGRVQAAAGVSAPTSRTGTGRSIGGTPFPACRCAVAARSADAARCSHPGAGRYLRPALG